MEKEEEEDEDGGGLVNQWGINLYHIEKRNQICLSSTLFVHCLCNSYCRSL